MRKRKLLLGATEEEVNKFFESRKTCNEKLNQIYHSKVLRTNFDNEIYEVLKYNL